jgi:hypothetical protein
MKQSVSTSDQLPRRTAVFCSFVGFAACINLKWLWLCIDFELWYSSTTAGHSGAAALKMGQ